jgi:hypothetical protein
LVGSQRGPWELPKSDRSTETVPLLLVLPICWPAQRFCVTCLQASGRRFDPGRAHHGRDQTAAHRCPEPDGLRGAQDLLRREDTDTDTDDPQDAQDRAGDAPGPVRVRDVLHNPTADGFDSLRASLRRRPPRFDVKQRAGSRRSPEPARGSSAVLDGGACRRLAKFLVAEGWSTTSSTRACGPCCTTRASPGRQASRRRRSSRWRTASNDQLDQPYRTCARGIPGLLATLTSPYQTDCWYFDPPHQRGGPSAHRSRLPRQPWNRTALPQLSEVGIRTILWHRTDRA